MTLAQKAKPFLNYLEEFLETLPILSLDQVVDEPEKTAIVSADMINAFLYEGPLSSPRVAQIDEPVTNLMKAAWERGVRDILLVQDAHSEESLEFDAYGSHAKQGTEASDAIDMIKALPFYNQLSTVYKDSIHPALNNHFNDWIEKRDELETFIAVGNVTDLCLYNLAIYLRFRANAFHRERRVIVPENCVQTWHLSVKDAKDVPAMPHHGDLLHATFLYHLALNGVEVVKQITI